VIDERDLVEQAVRALVRQKPALDDLIQRRDRRRRNQRITAGVVGMAVFVAAIWVVTSVGSPDRSETSVGPAGDVTGPAETGPTETGPVAPDPDAGGIDGLPPEGDTPSTPASGELVVQLSDGAIPGGSHDQVWVYADGRVISRVYLPTLEPYSGLVEQHLTPEGVEFLRSTVLSTGLFEHDLDLVREDPMCCLYIGVRDGDRLVRVSLGPRWAPSDRGATPEQVAALESLSALLSNPDSWPATAWTDQQIRPYVPSSYSFCSRWAEPSRVLALLPERARDLLGAEYSKMDGNDQPVDCARVTTEEARALARILMAEFAYEGGASLGFSFMKPGRPASYVSIAIDPVLPHDESAPLAGHG
jgi:hypothetical protein